MAEFGIVMPNYYHKLLVTDVLLPPYQLLRNQGPSHMNFAFGDYLMLYASLSNCDWTYQS
jgi:hypothetical protein